MTTTPDDAMPNRYYFVEHNWQDTSIYDDKTGKRICLLSLDEDLVTEENQTELEDQQRQIAKTIVDALNRSTPSPAIQDGERLKALEWMERHVVMPDDIKQTVYAVLSQPPVTVPDGFVLVPIEPTNEMLNAMCDRKNQYSVYDSYKAMLSAARAVIARWDTPAWKESEPTAEVIDRLRMAVDAVPPPQPDPRAEAMGMMVEALEKIGHSGHHGKERAYSQRMIAQAALAHPAVKPFIKGRG